MFMALDLFPCKLLSICVWKSLSEDRPKMGITLIVKCTKCAGLMLTTKGQKTKICPYCGEHVNVLQAQKVASVNGALEASKTLRKLKSEQGFTRKQS
jgi:acetyl-CoA carboxylase beta subunit